MNAFKKILFALAVFYTFFFWTVILIDFAYWFAN